MMVTLGTARSFYNANTINIIPFSVPVHSYARKLTATYVLVIFLKDSVI